MAKFNLFEAYRELKEIEDEKQEAMDEFLFEAYRELKEIEDEKQEAMDEFLFEAYRELKEIEDEKQEAMDEVVRSLNAESFDAEDYSPVPDMEFLKERVAFLVSLRAKMDALEAEKEATTTEDNGSLSGTNEELCTQELGTAYEPMNEIEEEGEQSKKESEN
ncbi:uncharacterized protein LOC126581045 [Anopheles aquasalis]|uniref:uncharacterized protein LOC126581045 n=1 Tax=Anopheles aquasalis TaxID=42839 RepID=UPI00215ACA93|nr:uncharacterized protein LOC126581045 [Anopheles aquasalis]